MFYFDSNIARLLATYDNELSHHLRLQGFKVLEHLNQEQFENYNQRRLPAAELLVVSEHLIECDSCRQLASVPSQVDSSFFALRADILNDAEPGSSHLSPALISAYLDQQLTGEELQQTNDHLLVCSECATAVDDLRHFAADISPTLDREYKPSSQAETSGWWGRLTSQFPEFFRSPIPALGTAAAILFLITIGWLIWRAQLRGPVQQAVVTPTPAPSIPVETPLPPPQPESPVVVAQLNDGGYQLALDQKGELSGAEKLPTSYQALVKRALTNQRIERARELNGLSRPSSALMGGIDKVDFVVTDPIGVVLLNDRPAFHWSAMPGVAVYVVQIFDEKFSPVATSPEVNGQTWTPTNALARGKVYTWQVKAIKEGVEAISPKPPAPQAKFRVVDVSTANELAQARKAYGTSHLVMGLLYADAGLLKESEQELRLLLKANPNSDVARNLLRQVQELRH